MGAITGLIALCIIYSCVWAQETPSDQGQISGTQETTISGADQAVINLPMPDHSQSITLDNALSDRRSVREYQNTSISAPEISNLLWAAQGITDPQTGNRSAPSGQKIYPITLHVAISRGTDIPPGVYAYHATEHQLVKELDAPGEQNLVDVLGQKSVASAPVCIVMSGNYTPYQKFGNDMANQSMYLEAGHIAQNFLLELTSLHLSGVPLSGFDSEKVGTALGLDGDHPVLYGIVFGRSS